MNFSKVFLPLLMSIYFLGITQNAKSQQFYELAQTPPMGWNSWNKFGCDINEDLIREITDALAESGMLEAGYEYIVIDDCWQIDRDSAGNIIADPERFPSGIKALADYVHSRGAKFGIYSSAGSKTCKKRPGSRGYEFQDARQYAQWKVDYLKYDWCYSEGQNARAAYKTMSDALKECGRPIVFSICEHGGNNPWEWGTGIGHLWRTTSDIINVFQGVKHWGGLGVLDIIDKQADLWRYAGPGHWNDPDMLQVGNGGMNETEYITHFSMWAMMAAPLMAGNDLRDMDESTQKVLLNKEVIAVDQDPVGFQGRKYLDFGEHEIWLKGLTNNEWALCFLNRSKEEWSYECDWQDFKFSAGLNKLNTETKKYSFRDLWKHNNLGITDIPYTFRIEAHGVVMLRLTPTTGE